MPLLIRLHPGSIANYPKAKVAVEITPDPRIAPNGFMMLVKGNATEGTEHASNKA